MRVPRGASNAGSSPGANDVSSSVVDVDPIWRRRGQFVSVERGVGARDHRPRVRVGGRFAGEVSGVEFGDGGVEVLEVEHVTAAIRSSRSVSTRPSTSATNPWLAGRSAMRVRVRTRRSPRVAMTSTVNVRRPEICDHPHVLDLGIPTAAGSGAGYPPPIVAAKVVGQNRSDSVPVARA